MNINNISFPEKKINRFGVFLVGCIDYAPNVAKSLPGVATELEKFSKSIKATYHADVLSTYDPNDPSSKHIGIKDLKKHSKAARLHFANKQEELQALLIVYSGHGLEDTLWLSDGKKFQTNRFESFFNKDELPSFADKPIIFIYCKCRGNMSHTMKVKDKNYHRDENTMRIFATSSGGRIADSTSNGGSHMLTGLNDFLENVAPVVELPIQNWIQATSAFVHQASKHQEAPVLQDQTSYSVILVPKKK